jgi:hypothetical protein
MRAGWLVCSLAGWRASWLAGWHGGCWLACCQACWLADWLAGHWLLAAGWLAGWLTGCPVWNQAQLSLGSQCGINGLSLAVLQLSYQLAFFCWRQAFVIVVFVRLRGLAVPKQTATLPWRFLMTNSDTLGFYQQL